MCFFSLLMGNNHIYSISLMILVASERIHRRRVFYSPAYPTIRGLRYALGCILSSLGDAPLEKRLCSKEQRQEERQDQPQNHRQESHLRKQQADLIDDIPNDYSLNDAFIGLSELK